MLSTLLPVCDGLGPKSLTMVSCCSLFDALPPMGRTRDLAELPSKKKGDHRAQGAIFFTDHVLTITSPHSAGSGVCWDGDHGSYLGKSINQLFPWGAFFNILLWGGGCGGGDGCGCGCGCGGCGCRVFPVACHLKLADGGICCVGIPGWWQLWAAWIPMDRSAVCSLLEAPVWAI